MPFPLVRYYHDQDALWIIGGIVACHGLAFLITMVIERRQRK